MGEWTNEGSCIADGDDATCGTGTQKQERTCTDGTIDMCTAEETKRDVTCAAAGTALPVCSMFKISYFFPETPIKYSSFCFTRTERNV